MCFELDSEPPIPVISGAAVSHDDLSSNRRTAPASPRSRPRPTSRRPSGSSSSRTSAGLYRFYEELALRFAERGYAAVAFDYFGRTAGASKRGRRLRVHGARPADDAGRRPGRRRRLASRSCGAAAARRSSPSASASAAATPGSPRPAATASPARSASTGCPPSATACPARRSGPARSRRRSSRSRPATTRTSRPSTTPPSTPRSPQPASSTRSSPTPARRTASSTGSTRSSPTRPTTRGARTLAFVERYS